MPELASLLADPLDLFTAVIASVCHDVGHTGHNNAFHVATQSEFAILYSDQSVLEMHHLATCFQLLAEPETALLKTLSDEARKEVRSRTIGMVLATDLAFNFPTINSFKQMVSEKAALVTSPESAEEGTSLVLSVPSAVAGASKEAPADTASGGASGAAEPAGSKSLSRNSSAGSVGSGGAGASGGGGGGGGGSGTAAGASGSSGGSSDGSRTLSRRRSRLSGGSANLKQWQERGVTITSADTLLILKMILKCADISNVTKGREYCLWWTKNVVDEFFTQGDLEAQLQLPVTPFMDRSKACIPKQQLGFYNFIARPMYEAMDMLVSMQEPLSNLDLMYEHWSEQLPDDVQEPQTNPQPLARAPSRLDGGGSAGELNKRHSQADSRMSKRLSKRFSRRERSSTEIMGGTSSAMRNSTTR